MKVSVVIVTRNRQSELLHCLGSLVAQSVPPDELIIVDNNSTDDTRKVILNFKRNIVIPLRYVWERKTGYPIVYNRGLKEAQFPWVAFIDDDCVADSDWLVTIKEAVKQKPLASALIGPSDTYFKNNVYSMTTLLLDTLWKLNARENKKIIDCEILDNKNVVYNKKFLMEKNISFDESRVKYGNGASEDCDLGMQIQTKGGKAYFAEGMKVTHKDPFSFTHYYRKLFVSTLAHRKYEVKWAEERQKKVRPRRVKLGQYLKAFIQERKLHWLTASLLILNVGATLVIVKAVKFLRTFK